MSDHLFSEPQQYGMVRCVKRRRLKPGRGKWLLIFLFVLFCLWFMSRCNASAAAVPFGYMVAFILASGAVFVLAVRKARQNEQRAVDNFGEVVEPYEQGGIDAELQWSSADSPFKKMTRESLREIVLALRTEDRVSLLFVEAALTTTNLDPNSQRAAHCAASSRAQTHKPSAPVTGSLPHGVHRRRGLGGVGVQLYRITGSCLGDMEKTCGYGATLEAALKNGGHLREENDDYAEALRSAHERLTQNVKTLSALEKMLRPEAITNAGGKP